MYSRLSSTKKRLLKIRREQLKHTIMGLIQDLAMQLGGNVIGTGMGLALQGSNDRRQIRQQQKLQDMQIAGQQQMTDYNMAKQLEMWKATSYSAQVEQMKKAGINPGLLYGMGGGGGQTTGSANGTVSAGSAPQGGGEIQAMTGMGMQMQLLKAQKENIEADTANKKAQTTKTAGVDTTKTQTEIASLTQGIDNQKAQQDLTEVQTNLANIEEEIKGATQNAAKALVMQTLRSSYETMEMIKNDGKVNKETMDEKIKIVEQELIGAYARNELTRAQTGKTDAEKEQLAKTIALEYAKLKNETDKTKISQQIANFETSFGKQASSILSSILGAVKR